MVEPTNSDRSHARRSSLYTKSASTLIVPNALRGHASRDAPRHKWHRLRGSEPDGCFKSRLRLSLPPRKLVFNLAILFLEGLGVLLLFAVGGRGDDLVDALGR